MRWVSKLLALAATGALGTNAMEASIFKFPNGAQRDQSSLTISEDFAQLILDLRVKSSLASVLGSMETDKVDRLDHLAETQVTLFGGATGHDVPEKSLVVIEGLGRSVGTYVTGQTEYLG